MTRHALEPWLIGLCLVGGCSAAASDVADSQAAEAGAVDVGADQLDTDDAASIDAAGADAAGADAAGTDAEVQPQLDAAASGPCTAWATATQTGVVQSSVGAGEDAPTLGELSGLARSHNGWLWAHNDSGETTARLFLLNPTGQLRAVLTVPGVVPVDWEDIAAGSCGAGFSADKRCLWIGDIGDNAHTRATVSVVRVLEPTQQLATALPSASTVAHWQVPPSDVHITQFQYPPDGATTAATLRPDAEALAVRSDGRLLVATKRDDGLSRLFRVTPGTGTVVAVLLGTLNVRDPPLEAGLSLRVTAADLDGDGRLLVRAYFRAWAFDFAAPLTAALPALAPKIAGATRQKLETGFDVQGESIASDGHGGFWHTSELENQPLWHILCAP